MKNGNKPHGEMHYSADDCFEAIKDEWSELIPPRSEFRFNDGVTVTNNSYTWVRVAIYGPQEEID
jgi:hypothetical protein